MYDVANVNHKPKFPPSQCKNGVDVCTNAFLMKPRRTLTDAHTHGDVYIICRLVMYQMKRDHSHCLST